MSLLHTLLHYYTFLIYFFQFFNLQQQGATKLQSMFRAKKAKQKVAKRKAAHDAEMELLQKSNAKESELAALREKQEMELAAMKLQAIYRGRKLRMGFDDVKNKRLIDINKRKRKLKGELSAIKIQGMFRGFKARQILHQKMDAVKNRRRVSGTIFQGRRTRVVVCFEIM